MSYADIAIYIVFVVLFSLATTGVSIALMVYVGTWIANDARTLGFNPAGWGWLCALFPVAIIFYMTLLRPRALKHQCVQCGIIQNEGSYCAACGGVAKKAPYSTLPPIKKFVTTTAILYGCTVILSVVLIVVYNFFMIAMSIIH